MRMSTLKPTNMIWYMLENVEKRRIGLVKSNQYESRMCKLLGKELQTSGTCSFERFCTAEDADVRENRMAVVENSVIIIYDLSTGIGDKEKVYERIAELPLPVVRRTFNTEETSHPCVRWSPEGSLLTTSGTSLDRNALRVLDAATMEVVETVQLANYGSKSVFIHEHSRMNPALIALGTSVSRVLIADLRTGNVALSSSARHSDRIVGIGWSFSDENLLVSSSLKEALVWDKRYLSKAPAYVQLYYNHLFDINPDIKFLDHSRLLIMNCRQRIYMHDVYTGATLHVIDNVRLRGHKSRYKFGLNREANLVYFPVKRDIQGIDLTTNKVVMNSTGGHIYAVEMLLFNDYTKELYSLNGFHEAIIWSPFQ